MTLPIVLVTVSWAYVSINRYQTFAVQHDPRPFKISLSRIAEEEALNLVRRVVVAVDPRISGSRATGGGLRVVQLFARQPALAQLNSELPYSGLEYVKGLLENDKKLRKVQLRYRGDFLQHWWSAKKSYRVKTKRKQTFPRNALV